MSSHARSSGPTVLHAVHLLVALSLHGPYVHEDASARAAWHATAEVDETWEPASGRHHDPALGSVDDVEDSDEDPRADRASAAGVAVHAPDGTHAQPTAAPTHLRRADSVAAHAPRGPPIA